MEQWSHQDGLQKEVRIIIVLLIVNILFLVGLTFQAFRAQRMMDDLEAGYKRLESGARETASDGGRRSSKSGGEL